MSERERERERERESNAGVDVLNGGRVAMRGGFTRLCELQFMRRRN